MPNIEISDLENFMSDLTEDELKIAGGTGYDDCGCEDDDKDKDTGEKPKYGHGKGKPKVGKPPYGKAYGYRYKQQSYTWG